MTELNKDGFIPGQAVEFADIQKANHARAIKVAEVAEVVKPKSKGKAKESV